MPITSWAHQLHRYLQQQYDENDIVSDSKDSSTGTAIPSSPYPILLKLILH